MGMMKTRAMHNLCVHKESRGSRPRYQSGVIQTGHPLWNMVLRGFLSPHTWRWEPHFESGERTLSWARGRGAQEILAGTPLWQPE